MNSIIDIIIELFFCMTIGYNIKIFLNDYRKQHNMLPIYKYFYVGGYIGFIISMLLLLALLHLFSFYSLKFSEFLAFWMVILFILPASALVNLVSWLKNAEYNKKRYGILLPANYPQMKRKLYFVICGGCLAMCSLLLSAAYYIIYGAD